MNKKRILVGLICIIISLSVVLTISKKMDKSIETVSMPVTGKVIVLDAGHGKPDEWGKLLKLKAKPLCSLF